MKSISALHRLGLLLVLALSTAAGCDCRSERQMDLLKDAKYKKAEQRVEQWLREVRFREADNPRAKASGTEPTYEAWLEEGKGFIGATEIAILNRFLSQRDSRVDPAEIAYALGWVGDKSSVPVLLEATDDKDVRLRIEAAASLGQLGDPRAVSKLCKVAQGDSDANVRGNAVSSLGRFASQEARHCLQQALNDESPFVRQMAQQALRDSEGLLSTGE